MSIRLVQLGAALLRSQTLTNEPFHLVRTLRMFSILDQNLGMFSTLDQTPRCFLSWTKIFGCLLSLPKPSDVFYLGPNASNVFYLGPNPSDVFYLGPNPLDVFYLFLFVGLVGPFLFFFPSTQPKHKNASDCKYIVVVKSKLVICSDLMKHKPCISWTDPPQRIGLCSSFTPIIIHPDHIMWDSCYHRVPR